jgi:pyruvate/2-oxoglutarate dehydrogenase complex dihydrolipoamide dehydrogenase (E3) component
MSKRLLVIGGGSVGVYAAREAARLGAQVTLISEGEIGGRTTWDSLVPSKVLLAAADTIMEARARPLSWSAGYRLRCAGWRPDGAYTTTHARVGCCAESGRWNRRACK